MNIARSLQSLPYKESSIVPHARATQCAIYLTDQTEIQNGEPATAQFRFVAGSLQETPMITHPTPHLEARPATPAVQHRPHLHLPGRPHLRPAPQDTEA